MNIMLWPIDSIEQIPLWSSNSHAENLVEVYPKHLIHGTISAARGNCFPILELIPK